MSAPCAILRNTFLGAAAAPALPGEMCVQPGLWKPCRTEGKSFTSALAHAFDPQPLLASVLHKRGGSVSHYSHHLPLFSESREVDPPLDLSFRVQDFGDHHEN